MNTPCLAPTASEDFGAADEPFEVIAQRIGDNVRAAYAPVRRQLRESHPDLVAPVDKLLAVLVSSMRQVLANADSAARRVRVAGEIAEAAAEQSRHFASEAQTAAASAGRSAKEVLEDLDAVEACRAAAREILDEILLNVAKGRS